MAYTVRTLINNSWYLSGIVSRRFQTVSGDQTTEGLSLLNAVLSFKTANNRLIPYYSKYEFNAVIGQELYFIPNLILIETVTFNLQTVRFPMQKKTRKQYWGSPRVNNISSLPGEWEFERTKGGANLYIYFLPNQTYPFTIFGKFALSNVTLDQDLSLTMDQFYIDYLRYALGDYMCESHNRTFPPNSAQRLAQYEQTIFDISPMDLTLTKKSTLQRGSGIDWQSVNFPGWRPS